MRHHLAKLAPAFLVGGCSLIYNPSNIGQPPVDATDAPMIDMGEVPVDVEVRMDAMPLDLTVDSAFPMTINEGAGTDDSRKAVVVLRGHNFIKDPAYNLSVTLTPTTAGAVTLDSFEASGNNDYIALELTAPIDTECDAGTSIPVDVTVAQSDGAGGTVTAPLAAAFSVTCLNELDAAPATAADLEDLYSRVLITGDVDLGASPDLAIIRSASTISISGTVDVSAQGQAAGPGGGGGGGVGGGGAGLRPGGGVTALNCNGGGAGFVVAGTMGAGNGLGCNGGTPGGTTGDPWITRYTTSASSGGGGGANNALAAGGGPGGGGGGTLELTAPGNISTGAVTANGGAGGAGTSGGADGGAGTGGVVIVRAGGTLTIPSIAINKGAKTGSGGASSDGRLRVDAADGAYPTAAGTECAFPVMSTTVCSVNRGPMFVALPTKSTTQMHMIALRGLPNDDSSTLRVFDVMGNPVGGNTYTPVFGTNGNATVTAVLKAGYNKVCVWAAGSAPNIAESTNCAEIAYLPL